ncbi:MAG: hypothetical protein H6843_13350 [Rhodospirillaceae bacterium]|nr:hypothetical protein [Rhodospirillaceae bacterium]
MRRRWPAVRIRSAGRSLAGGALLLLAACSSSPPPVASTPALPGTQANALQLGEACPDTVAAVAQPASGLEPATLEIVAPGDWAVAQAVARGYPNDAAAAARVRAGIDAQIDCVVHLLLNSGAVTDVRLVRYSLTAREPTPGVPQVVVSPVVLRETLDLAWRFRDSTGEVPLLFQAEGSYLPGPSEGRALVDHFSRLMDGWRPPDFGAPSEHLAYCDLGNPCAPVWETTY